MMNMWIGKRHLYEKVHSIKSASMDYRISVTIPLIMRLDWPSSVIS